MEKIGKPNEFCTEENVEETTRILRDLRTPDELIQSASGWLSSSLYLRYVKEDPLSPPYQILKTLLSDVLDELQEENEEYANILRDRFWKGLTVKEIVLNSPWSERTYFSLQSKAIKLFAFLLLQKEKASSNHIQGPNPSVQPGESTKHPAQPKPPQERRMGGHLVYGTLFVVLVFSAVWILLFVLNQEQPPVSHLPAPGTQIEAANPAKIVSETEVPETNPSNTGLSYCGENERVSPPSWYRFVRWEGVSVFNNENTGGGVLTDQVRTLANSSDGLWVGYFSEADKNGGVGQYDKESWAICQGFHFSEGQNVNIVVVDHQERVWVGFERHGIALFVDGVWSHFTVEDGLPSNSIYGITVDDFGVAWVGTWEGIARYDGEEWTVPYTVMNDTIFNNRVHSIAFDSERNIWVGHVSDGVSHYNRTTGEWVHYVEGKTGLSGDSIRSILVKPGTEDDPESIWIATSGGGISKFQNGEWSVYRKKDGLPGNDVRHLAFDRFNRVWAATEGGAAYLGESGWILYHSYDTHSISVARDCEGCVFDEDVVWTAIKGSGLTHSRLPMPEPVFDVRSVCFVNAQRERVCPEIQVDEIGNQQYISAAYPVSLSPGDTLRFEVTVVPRTPYQLRDNRGDFLSSADMDDYNLFGAWPIIGVGEVVEPGQPYTFTDYDNPFTVPELEENSEEKFTSTWRVWMHTRYAGPYIRMSFLADTK
jgi:hypothetical protein